jgi:hypothetical protein
MTMTHLLRHLAARLAALLALAVALPAAAVTGVNPFGVNVRSNGPTTIFLTFQNLDPGETAVEAFWCGELLPAITAGNANLQLPFAVQAIDPCEPASVYGRLPLRLDRARTSTSGAFANLTDIMSIPASVARRALQDAQAGLNSAFFYVRRFSGPAGDRYVIVTCRMAGGGARVALALLNVDLRFAGERGTASIAAVHRGEPPPPFAARLQYNGSGTLKGRWEVVMPGDAEPTVDDLLTEATLPVEQRPLQRRYTLIDVSAAAASAWQALHHAVDQRAHARVLRAFGQLAVVLAQFDDLVRAERLLQQRRRVQVIGAARAAGRVVDLARRVALQQQQAAGHQRLDHLREQPAALRRRRELDEDRHHHVERGRGPGEGLDIGHGVVHRHAVPLRQRARLVDPARADVERGDRKPLLRQPHAVASFAIGHAQRALARAQPMRLLAQEHVGCGAKDVVVARKARVPGAAGSENGVFMRRA